jgi:tetratricopeptide (TPR) repeat protein
MKQKIIILILFFGYAVNVPAQGTADFERRLYNSYVDGNMRKWKAIIPEMVSAYERDQDPLLLYSLCFARYGYIGYCLDYGLENEAEEYLKEALLDTEELEDIYNGRHDVLALRGALLGFRIVLSNYRAVYLGPRVMGMINTASGSGDKYFNCSLEMANMLYHIPGILGGSKQKAVEYYRKAVATIEQSHLKEDRNWLYLHTVLSLANAYYETGSRAQACELYGRLLEYEPRAGWIRENLYSKCIK